MAYREASYDSGIEARFAAETYASIITSLPAMRGRALDIGAGDGAFVQKLLEAGFREVIGVEPSSAPIAAASSEVRPFLRQELFSADAFDEGSFDLVTCFQTIEHVYNPQELLDGMTRVLRPGGYALLVMHDQASLSARLLGMRSPIYDIEHLQLFSEAPARFLMSRFKYEDVRVMPIVNRYPIRYWARLSPVPGPFKQMISSLLRGKLGDTVVALRAGNLAVIGRKA
jgi:SAM-dependent methyltransferase